MTDQKPEVREEWDRLMAVLRRRGAEKTVAAIAPPLEPDAVRAALDTVAGVSVFVYGDLSDWLLCHNGFREGAWTRLFPDLDLLSASQMADTWQMMLQTYPAESGHPLFSGPPAYGFIRQYIPIAERDGYLWVVDSRPGEKTHQVLEFDKVGADEDATTWPSIGALLQEITDAIDNGTGFNGSTPAVVDGELTWDLN